MKAFLAAFALAVSTAYAQLMVNTPPSAVVCQPLLITWTEGTPPYFLSILPGNQPGAAALVDFGTIESGTQHTWLVNLPANTLIGINLRDSTGALSQSAPFTINPGADTSCLTATTTTSSGSTTGPTTGSTTSGGATTTSTTPTTATTPRPTTSATTPRTTTSTPATNTSAGAAPLNTNAASKLTQAGFVGVAAAVAAVLLA